MQPEPTLWMRPQPPRWLLSYDGPSMTGKVLHSPGYVTAFGRQACLDIPAVTVPVLGLQSAGRHALTSRLSHSPFCSTVRMRCSTRSCSPLAVQEARKPLCTAALVRATLLPPLLGGHSCLQTCIIAVLEIIMICNSPG